MSAAGVANFAIRAVQRRDEDRDGGFVSRLQQKFKGGSSPSLTMLGYLANGGVWEILGPMP